MSGYYQVALDAVDHSELTVRAHMQRRYPQRLLHHQPPHLHASAHVSIRQHTYACVSIRQHTSTYVSIRQHTSAYVRLLVGQPRLHLACGGRLAQEASTEEGAVREKRCGRIRLVLRLCQAVGRHVRAADRRVCVARGEQGVAVSISVKPGFKDI